MTLSGCLLAAPAATEMSIRGLNSLGSVDESTPLEGMTMSPPSLFSFSRTASDGLARDRVNYRLNSRGTADAKAATWHPTTTRTTVFGTDDVIPPVLPFHAKLELNKAKGAAKPHHFSTVIEY